ncbi:MAG: hypothetical protein K9N49_08570 [Candidatus Marinimicrobia bacterium]|nr:hypothetical protein [Candidatus Neomarinimicrobiota bacterium]
MIGKEERPQRCHPAHHAPVERFNEPVIVQVNVCTKDRRAVLACDAGHQLCRAVWRAADHWRVGRYVIMPDHVHLFCAPGRFPMPGLRQWVEFWKSRIAAQWPGGTGSVRSVGHPDADDTEVVPPGDGYFVPTRIPPVCRFKLWQRDYWDTQMRSRAHYEDRLLYVRLNPVRRELVTHPEDWPYQGEIFPLDWL